VALVDEMEKISLATSVPSFGPQSIGAPRAAPSPGGLKSMSPVPAKPVTPATTIRTMTGIPAGQIKPSSLVQKVQTNYSQPQVKTQTGNPGVTAGAKGLPSPPVRS